MLPLWLQAALWGLLAGSALLIGAAVGYFLRIPPRWIAAIMAFGSGVLISALAFELMEDAYRRAGFGAAALGFLAGALLFTTSNWVLEHQGARHRKRSAASAADPKRLEGGSLPIAVGALIDGVPESMAIGTSMLAGGKVGLVTVAAGAILAMLVDTMIPEAFETAHSLAGLITALGFLLSFMLSKLAG